MMGPLSTAGVSLTLTALALGAHAASFTPIGDLAGGPVDSTATGISDDGSVVVGTGTYGQNQIQGFRWTAATGIQGLGSLPGELALGEASGVSRDGQLVVGTSYRNGYGLVATRWTAETGLVPVPGLAPNNPPFGALGVSGDGSVVVGGLYNPEGPTGYRWSTSGGLVTMGDLPGGQYSGTARGVSADGLVVVGQAESAAGREATAWTASGGLVSLGSLGGGYINAAYGASTDGSTIVGSALSPNIGLGGEPFSWTSAGGMVALRDLSGGACYGRARAVSGAGSVIVGECNLSGFDLDSAEAFVWTATDGLQRLFDVLVAQGTLGLDGWILRSAAAISSDGHWIAGWGVNPTGGIEAFRAQLAPVPVPAGLWLMGGALAGLACVRRRAAG